MYWTSHIGIQVMQQSLVITIICFNFIYLYDKMFKTLNAVKGAGGSMTLGRTKSSFLLFPTEGSVSYQMLFTRSKKIVPSRSYRILKS